MKLLDLPIIAQTHCTGSQKLCLNILVFCEWWGCMHTFGQKMDRASLLLPQYTCVCVNIKLRVLYSTMYIMHVCLLKYSLKYYVYMYVH